MKRVWIGLTLMLLLAAQNMQAQETMSKFPLPGIWRMYLPVSSGVSTKGNDPKELQVLKPTIFHKLLEEDGRFTNLAVTPTSSVITGYGTYETLSDKQYVEHIEESFTNPAHTGTDNVLTYFWMDANRFMLSYEGPMGLMYEFWVRVRQPEQ
jgi:hypothetical protein